MKSLLRMVLCALAAGLAATSTSAENGVMPVVTDAWVKATLPGSDASAAYMRLTSATPLKLVKAETSVAGIVELHNMNMKDGVMEMKALDAVELPAGQAVELKPSGMHIMLMQVKRPIKAGDKVPLMLTFARVDGKRLVMKIEARARDPFAPKS